MSRAPTFHLSNAGRSPWIRRAAIALLLLALALGPAVVVLLTRDDDEATLSSRPQRISDLPTDVAVAGGRIWVTSAGENRVVALVPGSPPVPDGVAYRTGSAPLRVAADETGVWTTNAADNSVTRLDPLRGGAETSIEVGADAVDVAVSGDAVWVSNGARGTVTRIDPLSGRVLRPRVRTGNFPTALAVGEQYLWVVNSGDGTLARVDPRENLVVGRRTPVGRDPQDVTLGFGSVWVANRGDGTLTRVSAETGKRQDEPIRLGGAPSMLAVTRDSVLVLDTDGNRVLWVDPRSGQVRRTVAVPGSPSSFAVGEGAVWVADAREGKLTRLGM